VRAREGALAHFHVERLRELQPELEPDQARFPSHLQISLLTLIQVRGIMLRFDAWSSGVQFPSRPSKAELAGGATAAGAAVQGSRSAEDASAVPSAAAAGSSGADLLLVWSLPGSDGQPSAIGAHHLHGLLPKVCPPTKSACLPFL
jgi:hypothetical protein